MVVLGASRFIAVAVTVLVLWRIFCWRRSGLDLLREGVVALLFGWSVIVAYVTSEMLRYSEYKRVLPGRYTWTTRGDMIREEGSGYAQAVTAYNVTRAEKPVVAVWGRSEAAAEELVVRAEGQSPDRSAAIEKYFLVAFVYDDRADVADDGLLDGLSYRFVDGSGRDVTRRFAHW